MNISQLIEGFLKSKWGGVKRKKGKKLESVTTNDLDERGKLNLNYLNQRKQRKKKKAEPKSFGGID